MIFSEIKSRLYSLLQDQFQTAWTNSTVAAAVTKAVRKVGNKVGRDSSRTTLALVQGQIEYTLPLGVRRLSKIRILPENGNEPDHSGLDQIDYALLPVVNNVSAQADPTHFALSLTGGAGANQYLLTVFPAPARNAVDAIIIDFEVDTVIESDNPSTGPQDAQIIPYPEQFEEAIVYYSASYLLLERSDSKDTEESRKYRKIANQEIRENRPVDALSFYRDQNRAMP